MRILLWHVHGSWATALVQGRHEYLIPTLPFRWTSLGLALLEAMHLGMPVIALATTGVPEAVPREAGVVSTRIDLLVETIRELMADEDRARMMGKAGREVALARYGLGRFLADWDQLLAEVAA